MVINGINQGYVLVDGVEVVFDMDFLLFEKVNRLNNLIVPIV